MPLQAKNLQNEYLESFVYIHLGDWNRLYQSSMDSTNLLPVITTTNTQVSED